MTLAGDGVRDVRYGRLRGSLVQQGAVGAFGLGIGLAVGWEQWAKSSGIALS
jgi:hypothetical protein